MKQQIPQFFSFDKSPIALLILGSLSLAIFFTILSSANAQELIGFYTNLTGMEEVPPTNTTASGLTVLLYNNESSQLSYLVNVTGLDKITQSSIHNGTRGINGDVVIPLKGNETLDNKGLASILFKDDMKEEDLQGPLDGKEITDLVKLMSNESAYVNILSEKNPNGEIRGQLYMGQIQLDPTGGITGLLVPGGVVKMTGVVLRNGVIVIETTRTIGFVPAPGGGSSPVDTGGVSGGVTSVVGELGGVVGKVGGTVNDVANIIDGSDGIVQNVGGTVEKVGGTVEKVGGTVEKVGGTVDNTVQKTGDNVEQASSAVVEIVDHTRNTLGNTVQKIDDGVTKILIKDDDDDGGDSNDDEKDDGGDSNDDEKDDGGDSNDDEKDDGGDSNDSDSNDDEKDDDDDEKDDDDDDDDGGSLKDTVKKLLS